MKTIEEKFEDYIKENSMNRMYMSDYVKAGYDIAKKELEEQLKECEDILRRVHDLEGETRFEEWFIGKARRYLEKWK